MEADYAATVAHDHNGGDDEDIPVIEASMLHPTVDFEAGMGMWPPATLTFMVACIIVFVFEVATGALSNLDRLVEMGALAPEKVEGGEWWRMLSVAFLHGGPDHLIGNMIMLYILGLACEHGFGRGQYMFLFVAAALGGSAASLTQGKISVGASGAIFGLAGAVIALLRRHRHVLHVRDRRLGIVLAIWAAYQILLGFVDPHIDNMAHIGGFFTGVVFGRCTPPAVLYDRKDFHKRPLTISLWATACVALLVMSACLIPRLPG